MIRAINAKFVVLCRFSAEKVDDQSVGDFFSVSIKMDKLCASETNLNSVAVHVFVIVKLFRAGVLNDVTCRYVLIVPVAAFSPKPKLFVRQLSLLTSPIS